MTAMKHTLTMKLQIIKIQRSLDTHEQGTSCCFDTGGTCWALWIQAQCQWYHEEARPVLLFCGTWKDEMLKNHAHLNFVLLNGRFKNSTCTIKWNYIQ